MSILIRGQIRKTTLIGLAIGAVAAILIFFIGQAQARSVITCNRFGCSDWVKTSAHKRTHTLSARRHAFDANGNSDGLIISHKTGARAHVSPRYAEKFQSYIDDLEAAGARIYFMGGYRKGRCSIPRHKHPCGMALDVCQLSRGRVAQRCHLPGRRRIAHIAAEHGLLEGGVWCHSDYGHAEVRTARQAKACGGRLAKR